jgi:hypothetical protein
MTVTRNAVGVASSFEAGTARRESEPVVKPGSRSHRVVLRSLALLLVRLGLGALVMAAWRIAADLGLPLRFVITGGLLSHWQVWFGAGVLLVGSAGLVARRLQFGRARDESDADRAEAA